MSDASQEQTLFRGSSSPVINLGTFVVCLAVIAVAGVVAFIWPQPMVYLGAGAAAAIAFIWMFVAWLLIRVRVYEVTTERIRVRNGLITRRTDEMELYRVKDTSLVEPLMLRMFGLGDIEITTHDVSTPLVRMEAIRGARELREELRKSIEMCRDKKRVRLAELE